MPMTARITPHHENGHVLLTSNLGPYYRSCPLGLRPLRDEERRGVQGKGHAYHVELKGVAIADALKVFNDWWATMRRLKVYLIRERGIPSRLDVQLWSHHLRPSGSPAETLPVAVPPQVSDKAALGYITDTLQGLGYRVDYGTVGTHHVVLIQPRA